jgi:hypothetical protein
VAKPMASNLLTKYPQCNSDCESHNYGSSFLGGPTVILLQEIAVTVYNSPETTAPRTILTATILSTSSTNQPFHFFWRLGVHESS